MEPERREGEDDAMALDGTLISTIPLFRDFKPVHMNYVKMDQQK